MTIDQTRLVTAITNELTRQHPDMPFCPDIFNAAIKAANIVVDECAREPVKPTKGMTIAQWFNTDDTGLSSKYMAYVIDGGKTRLPIQGYEYPRDASDFGRCLRMVEACELEKKVFLMLPAGKEWRHIATEWESLVGLYKAEDWEEFYELLRGHA
jgi:hypothetical protein